MECAPQGVLEPSLCKNRKQARRSSSLKPARLCTAQLKKRRFRKIFTGQRGKADVGLQKSFFSAREQSRRCNCKKHDPDNVVHGAHTGAAHCTVQEAGKIAGRLRDPHTAWPGCTARQLDQDRLANERPSDASNVERWKHAQVPPQLARAEEHARVPT